MADTVVLADKKVDEKHYFAVRKGYLTSSDMYSWRGVHSKSVGRWWSDDRAGIVREKFHGEEKVFGDEAAGSIAHGSYDEENIQRKFGHAIGAITENCNKLFGCSRWPGLAASIDGFVHRPMEPDAPYEEFCQDPFQMDEITRWLYENVKDDEAILCEIKKSVSVTWQKEVPEYYIPQLQCQMYILNLPAAVIVAETIRQMKMDGVWRKFWDLRPYIVHRDPDWEGILQQCNDEFLEVKRSYND